MWKLSVTVIRVVGLLAVASWLVVSARSAVLSHSPALCFSVEDTVAAKVKQFPESEVITHFREEDATEFMAFFNALSPVTDYKGDEIVGLHRSGEPEVLLLVFVRGCYTGMILMPPERLREFRPSVELFEAEPT